MALQLLVCLGVWKLNGVIRAACLTFNWHCGGESTSQPNRSLTLKYVRSNMRNKQAPKNRQTACCWHVVGVLTGWNYGPWLCYRSAHRLYWRGILSPSSFGGENWGYVMGKDPSPICNPSEKRWSQLEQAPPSSKWRIPAKRHVLCHVVGVTFWDKLKSSRSRRRKRLRGRREEGREKSSCFWGQDTCVQIWSGQGKRGAAQEFGAEPETERGLMVFILRNSNLEKCGGMQDVLIYINIFSIRAFSLSLKSISKDLVRGYHTDHSCTLKKRLYISVHLLQYDSQFLWWLVLQVVSEVSKTLSDSFSSSLSWSQQLRRGGHDLWRETSVDFKRNKLIPLLHHGHVT